MSRGSSGRMGRALRVVAASGLGALLLIGVGVGVTAAAEAFTQLDPLAKSYTLGRFRYEGPAVDGWRQIANSTEMLQLIYAEQPEPDKIDTKCHVALQVSDIPANVIVEGADALADTSRKQQAAQLGTQLRAGSPIAAVPDLENTYTYRFMAHAPDGVGDYDYYLVYYLMMAPDKSSYVIMQLSTRDLDYESKLYFQQFFASLIHLTYEGPMQDRSKDAAAAPAPGADKAAADKAAAEKAPAPAKDAAKAPAKDGGH